MAVVFGLFLGLLFEFPFVAAGLLVVGSILQPLHLESFETWLL